MSGLGIGLGLGLASAGGCGGRQRPSRRSSPDGGTSHSHSMRLAGHRESDRLRSPARLCPRQARAKDGGAWCAMSQLRTCLTRPRQRA
jgi:hypothetical protein